MAPREVYLDNSATTKVDPRVTEAMLPYFSEKYGNPNSLHKFGREARAAIDNARAQVASLINAKPTDIIFTGAGSEADNLAIKGAAWALKEKGKGSHIITSAIEHHAILDTVRWLGKMGFEYTILPVDDKGFVSPADLEAAIRPDTILATIMFANNEIGTIQPVKELGEVCRRHGVMFHVDGVQAAGHIKVDVEQLPIDMMTMAAHKMYGPKGLGALYVRRGVKLIPTLHGGGQEFGLRSGTENVPGIVGFGVAAEIAKERLERGDDKKLAQLRDYFIDGVLSRIPESHLTGAAGDARLPFHTSFTVKYIEGEGMLLLLDAAGIAASSGSACTSGSLEPSYVLLATGLDHTTAHGSVRLTMSHDTTKEDIDYVLEKFPEIVEKLRAMSPFYKK
ncbi:MAG: cysteine desulfurase NifS [Cloacibacillus porcorum]|uniref:cysteine desulfurase NifS n=1 Tax=Cloacibacillus porcorum TaxID=1197717 RepID=UPI002352C6FE|nr:cysteine desulfurase NifS [Cloacibacillus porcorum]MCD8392792.1 cysteine desulfurase NifS [Cloacibacillus porcorum]MCI5864465.1 cysteine desulfurase NifS [Cloacibacillus porcorum]MDD7648939.1 cysteine desulfurase NifS [Cloacibacillus porcorum]MDY4094290.1 cysteine desulfurase NifS [Cloacibacillus porcorum]